MKFFTPLKQALLALAMLLAVGALWFELRQPVAPVAVATTALIAPEVAHEARQATPVVTCTVQTLPKSVKRKLNLPAAVQAAQNQQVLDASKLPADDHTQTVSTVIDTNTGATETFVRRDPLPLFALDTGSEAGLYLGLRNGTTALRGDIRQGLFTVKALHFGAIASVDQPLGNALAPTAFVGAGIWTRW